MSLKRVLILVVAMIVMAAGVFVLTQRHVTTPVTRRQALERFRGARAHEGAGDQATLPTTPPSTASASSPGHGAQPLGNTRPTPPTSPSQAATGQLPYVVPAEGVYAYRTTGGDSLSIAGASHTYPPETYATVTHLGGCQWRNEFDAAHENTDVRTLCSEPRRLLELDDKRSITYFGQTQGEELRCDPPVVLNDISEAPGATMSGECHSGDASGRVQITYLGHQPVVVGGVAVDAVHWHAHAIITGRANGTADEEAWVVPQTGLMLRWDRLNDDNAHVFGADIHYHEKASFVLESLTPST